MTGRGIEMAKNEELSSNSHQSSEQQDEIHEIPQTQYRSRQNSRVAQDDTTFFDEINPEGKAELTRIASNFPRRTSSPSAGVGAGGKGIQRMDTVDEMALDDPAFDPTTDQFDHYKWARKMMKLIDREGFPRPPSMGISFQNLNVSGSGSALQYQNTVASLFAAPLRLNELLFKRSPEKHILHDFNGLIRSGELLIVLGRPGSGCSTFLKSLCGQLHGLKLGKDSEIQYGGISQETMLKEYKGEVLYNQEVDKHFAHLTVGQTLEFAAAARTPEHRLEGVDRHQFASYVTKVAMSIFGLSHTYNTKGTVSTLEVYAPDIRF